MAFHFSGFDMVVLLIPCLKFYFTTLKHKSICPEKQILVTLPRCNGVDGAGSGNQSLNVTFVGQMDVRGINA
eukprot:m.112572 g.112572  ORF g.112572 m.112572 type:complete len:72 (+) comp28199_c1_seq1:1042-1257(+)